MKKINILKKNEDFSRIIKNEKPYKYKDYIIYKENHVGKNYQFGISVGKKIGNAVVRNKIRRQIKNIIDQNNYQKGFNCIIIVKKGIIEKNFSEMKEDLEVIMKKIHIMEEIK